MPSLPVALQFYLNDRRVAFAAMIENPNASTIWASQTATRQVILPDKSIRLVGEGGAELVDVGAGPTSMLLRGVFIYADALGRFSDEKESWEDKAKLILPRLTITIQNTPPGASQQNLAVAAQDSTPQDSGDPFVPGQIDMFPSV